MKQSLKAACAAWPICVMLAMVVPLSAQEPAKKSEAVKTPWQRLLQRADAMKPVERKKKFDQLQEAGEFAEALKMAETSVKLRTILQGAEHWEAVSNRFELEAIRRVLKATKEEQQSYSRTFALRREADELKAKGRYREAQPMWEELLAIKRKVLGEEHPHTASCYNELAMNLNAQGKYQEAEEGYRKALTILRKVLGEEHPSTAAGYNNLATSLQLQGKYKEAEAGLRKALAICRKMVGEEDWGTGTGACYGNLAMNLNAQGKYKEAGEGFRKALAISRKVRGEEHPDTAADYRSLAFNLNAQGKYKEAEVGYRQALAIARKVLGEEHPDTAIGYHTVAGILNAQGKYKEAEEGYRKALTIWRKALGEEHPSTAVGYNIVAGNLNAQGRYKEAETLFIRAGDSFAKVRLQVAVTGLERADFTSKLSPLPSLAAVLARNGKPDEAWQRFEESLARGTWDDLTARLRRPQADRDQQAQITARIDRLNNLIGKVSVPKPTPEQGKQRNELLTQLRQAYDELSAFTKQLEKKYGPVAGQVFPRAPIQASLPADAAFVAWLDIAGQAKAADPNGEHWAILLRSAGPPIWIRLTGSGEKDAWTDDDAQLPSQLRAALQSSSREDWQPRAKRLCQQRLDPLAPHLKGVRHLIVLPSTALAGVPVEVIADKYTISYAHSGTMFAYLRDQPAPTGKGLFALADPVFDLPDAKDKPQPLPPGGVLVTTVLPGSNAHQFGIKPNDVLLRYGDTDLAGPADFKPLPESSDPQQRVPVIVWREEENQTWTLRMPPGQLGVALATEPAPQALLEKRRWDRRLASRSGENEQLDPLPGTRFEADALRRLFAPEQPTELLMDSQASEQRLHERAKVGALGTYRYVHLATHGKVDNDFPLRSAVILSYDNLPDAKQREQLLLEGQPIPDGHLTAAEMLSQWNLHCELVTLSACSTALGKYERSEGFVGFAQALILCGTRSVCLSLWKVDDTATALLMERFYQNLLGKRAGLAKPMAKAEALAEAKAWLRTLPRAEALKRAASLSAGVARDPRKKLPLLEVPPAAKADVKKLPVQNEDRPYAHPYYWAAFVLSGDPR